MTNKATGNSISKKKSKKITRPSQKTRKTEFPQSSHKDYYNFLITETLKLKEQKLKELLELETIHNQLQKLVEKNSHLKPRMNYV